MSLYSDSAVVLIASSPAVAGLALPSPMTVTKGVGPVVMFPSEPLAASTTPALIVQLPLMVLAAPSESEPAPVLVIFALPLITALIVALTLVVIVALTPPSVMV